MCLSVCQLAVRPACVCVRSKIGACHWSQAAWRGGGAVVLQWLEPLGSQYQLLDQLGYLTSGHGVETGCVPKAATGTDQGSMSVCDCTGPRVLVWAAGKNVCIFPRAGMPLCVCVTSKLSAGPVGLGGPQAHVTGRWGVPADRPRGTCKCGVHEG